MTTGESVTSSISCAKKYFEDEGIGKEQLKFFWYNSARYGRVGVMEWARQRGYSAVWMQQHDREGSIGFYICENAAQYGRLQAL